MLLKTALKCALSSAHMGANWVNQQESDRAAHFHLDLWGFAQSS